ncbi:hypothetical protein D3C81_1707820 [compost metagenome]
MLPSNFKLPSTIFNPLGRVSFTLALLIVLPLSFTVIVQSIFLLVFPLYSPLFLIKFIGTVTDALFEVTLLGLPSSL